MIKALYIIRCLTVIGALARNLDFGLQLLMDYFVKAIKQLLTGWLQYRDMMYLAI